MSESDGTDAIRVSGKELDTRKTLLWSISSTTSHSYQCGGAFGGPVQKWHWNMCRGAIQSRVTPPGLATTNIVRSLVPRGLPSQLVVKPHDHSKDQPLVQRVNCRVRSNWYGTYHPCMHVALDYGTTVCV